MRRVGHLVSALLTGLVLFLLLSGWLGLAASHPGLGIAEEVDAFVDPVKAALVPDARVAALMMQITTGTLGAYERALTGEEGVIIGGELYTLTTRNSYSGEPISQATRYAYERFESLGLEVAFHEYTWRGNRWRNVVAEQRGLRRPGEIYLITAHLDNLPTGSVAPGADDNASGSTAVLVAADLLSRLDFDCTLRFALFTGEEQGLRGSAAYAADIAAAGDDVHAVLNLDMIAYDSNSDPVVDLHARSAISGSLVIAETFSQVVAAYDLDITPAILVDRLLGNFSDNKSFWDQGYPAILAIEDYDDFTPFYHTRGDTLDTLDLGYFAEFVRTGVGTFAHLGCLSGTGLLTGTVTALDSGLPLSARVTASAFGQAYTTTTRNSGHYSLTLPVGTFMLRALPNQADYLPGVVTDVIIRAGKATVQHFALAPRSYQTFLPTLYKWSK